MGRFVQCESIGELVCGREHGWLGFWRPHCRRQVVVVTRAGGWVPVVVGVVDMVVEVIVVSGGDSVIDAGGRVVVAVIIVLVVVVATSLGTLVVVGPHCRHWWMGRWCGGSRCHLGGCGCGCGCVIDTGGGIVIVIELDAGGGVVAGDVGGGVALVVGWSTLSSLSMLNAGGVVMVASYAGGEVVGWWGGLHH